eukprot:TRINITY_DN6523_c0_g1_i1.p2 TRINITY_DN6523_c0_g1~~TRINITY_DN6523_c0_g1_i1.p2  ORF type:complete len:324 (-),score=77.79 TRINITY_DN6523_c0_g1_i1:1886-2857(-)
MTDTTSTTKFGAKSTAREVAAGVDLNGKVAIVTGGSSGLGIETARALAIQGATVYIAVRNIEKGEAVAVDIRASCGHDRVHTHLLDLGSIASARQSAQAFAAAHDALHILVDNAGIMALPKLTLSDDGIEKQFATNHIGHFVFTCTLVPLLIKSAPARVVVLSSLGHYRNGIDLKDINFETREYEKWTAYAQSKSANALFALELNSRLEGKGVTANSVHPGGILTGLQCDLTKEEMIERKWIDENGKINENFKTIEEGASTSTYLAVSPEVEGVGGKYFEDCHVAGALNFTTFEGAAPHIYDTELAAGLWAKSEELVAETFKW